MIYFEILDKEGRSIADTTYRFSRRLEFLSEKNFTLRDQGVKGAYVEFPDYNVWFIVENEPDLLNSNKLFNISLKAHRDAAGALLPYYTQKIRAHSHTLVTVQAQMKQKIDSLLNGGNLKGGTYAENIENLKKIILVDPGDSAETIFYLNKKSFEIEANIDGFRILHLEDVYDINLKSTNIKKAILNVLYPFFEEFKDQEIIVSLHEIDDEYAAENKIGIDFMLFDLALYNLFSNMTKYVMPSSSVSVKFVSEGKNFEISFSMMSCRIDKDELLEIFNEGYSGRHASSPGDGIGMAVSKKALNMMNMGIRVDPDYSKSLVSNGITYIRNTFKIFSN